MASDLIFYDGHCGLCHRFVRFALSRDPAGERFRFAPLEGETLRRRVPEPLRGTLPDSVAVLAADGRLLLRSTAVLYVLRRLGGFWRLLGVAGAVAPRGLRDRVYDWVAILRRKLFQAPTDVCPLIPPHLRGRFLP